MFKNKLFHVYLFIGYKKKAVINLLLLCFIILFIHYNFNKYQLLLINFRDFTQLNNIR